MENNETTPAPEPCNGCGKVHEPITITLPEHDYITLLALLAQGVSLSIMQGDLEGLRDVQSLVRVVKDATEDAIVAEAMADLPDSPDGL